MMNKATFKVGDRVWFRLGGKSGIARIIDIGDKDGRIVYDLDNGHWAYASQLELR